MTNLSVIIELSNGLRVAYRQTDGNVTYMGVMVDAGSRDERPDHPGLAHFVEHTIFKGTVRRSAWHISNRMESVGGELNAYTSKENTSVYCLAPAGYEDRGLELLADLICNSQFPQHELDKEREVIVEEINACLDNPSDMVFDRFEELLYSGSALAHNILGTPESVRHISSQDCREFIEKYYCPANMTAFISTPADEKRVRRLLEKYLGGITRSGGKPARVAPAAVETFDKIIDNNGHQAHTILGTRLFGRHDRRRFALSLLNNYLGGPGMNSRLNQELREKRGLVYMADSFVNLLSDTGGMFVYFGTEPGSVDKCLRIIRHEIDKLAQNPLRAKALDRIKDQYCGQLLVSFDNKESMATWMGKNLLFYQKLSDIREVASQLREVTAEEICEVAGLIAGNSSRLTLM